MLNGTITNSDIYAALLKIVPSLIEELASSNTERVELTFALSEVIDQYAHEHGLRNASLKKRRIHDDEELPAAKEAKKVLLEHVQKKSFT